MSNTQTAEVIESEQEPALSAGELKQQHAESKSTLDGILRTICRGNGATPQGIKDLGKQEKKLEQTGIHLDYVPEFLRPLYIKAFNLVQGPVSRLEKSKEGIEELATQLEEIEEEVTKTLYGANYTGLSGRLGGIHKEYQTMADDRFKCAKAIDSLKKEASATHQRIKKTEEISESKTEPEEIKEIHENLVGYRFDLERYEGIKRELEGNLEGYDQGIVSLQRDIEAATRFRNHLRRISQEARNALKVNKGARSQIDYTKMVSDLIPVLQNRLEEYIGMVRDFREKSNGDLGNIVSITQHTLNVPAPEEGGPSPFQGMEVEDEKRSVKISQRVEEILKKPYGDIYKVSV